MKTKSNRKIRAVAFLVIAIFLIMAVFPAALSAASKTKKPAAKNIIVMISDGWAYNHLDAVSYYEYGKDARQIYNRFPFQFAMSTYMADTAETGYGYCGWGYDPALAWSDFEYVLKCYTDSAAAATTMSTGVKTYQGAIGVDLDEQPLLHALEFAEEKGKATGVVTSVEWTHATPAGHVAHNVSRNNYAEIGQEMVYKSAADVIMGAGHPCYDADGVYNGCTNSYRYVGGEITWADLEAGRIYDAIPILEKMLSRFDENRMAAPQLNARSHYFLGIAYQFAGR